MSPELPESEIFALLARRRRRLTLGLLEETAGPVSTSALAERIGAREYDDPSAADLATVRIALSHNHLPRLQDADVVAYDSDEGTVYPGVNFDTVVRVLRRVDERDLPWSDE